MLLKVSKKVLVLDTPQCHLIVDFIATRGSEKYYIQSAFSLTSQETYFREKESISKINDFNNKSLLLEILLN